MVPRWVNEDCPGSGSYAANVGDAMGFCIYCRKPIVTNGAGKLRIHTVSVLKNDE